MTSIEIMGYAPVSSRDTIKSCYLLSYDVRKVVRVYLDSAKFLANFSECNLFSELGDRVLLVVSL